MWRRDDTSSVMPFWQAALGYVRRGDTPDEDLVDPRPRTRVLIPSRWRSRVRTVAGPIHIVCGCRELLLLHVVGVSAKSR